MGQQITSLGKTVADTVTEYVSNCSPTFLLKPGYQLEEQKNNQLNIEKSLKKMKMVLLGAVNTGKSQLFNKFCGDDFINDYLPTMGCEFQTKRLFAIDSKTRLHIWDISGGQFADALQEQDINENQMLVGQHYPNQQMIYFNLVDIAFIIYDITNRESFKNIEKQFISRLERFSKSSLKMIGIIGNKSELESSRQISIQDGQNFCQLLKSMFQDAFVFFLEISIKTGKNLDSLFVNLYEFELQYKRDFFGRLIVLIQQQLMMAKFLRPKNVAKDIIAHFLIE